MITLDNFFDDKNRELRSQIEEESHNLLEKMNNTHFNQTGNDDTVNTNTENSSLSTFFRDADTPINKYWNRIVANSRPHKFFKRNWSFYYSLDFADIFLPYADCIRAKALWMYDAAELFEVLKTSQSKQFSFQQSLFSLVSYTYPENAEARQAKKLVQAGENEICTFIEVKENDDINIHFRLGSNFKKALATSFASNKIDIDGIEEKAFTSTTEGFKEYFEGELVHADMMMFVLNTIGITNISGLYKLESHFAQEQLKRVAKEMGKPAFLIFMLNVFGKDIENNAILKLFDDLLNDKISSPEIVVTENALDGRKANYSAKDRKIYIWQAFIDNALNNENIKAELLVALVEEYGHHIDALLRTDYSENKIPDTDYLDEGAKFVFFFLTKTTLKLTDIEYGKAETPYYSGKLQTTMNLLKQAAEKIYTNSNLYDANPAEELEGFGAGFTPGTHGGIELEALSLIYEPKTIYSIYYGNWLRDYSQVIVGTTVRITDEAKKELEQKGDAYILDLLKKNSSKISHEGWVEMLEILAAKELVFNVENPGKNFCHQYKDYIEKFRDQFGQLTKDRLGIYRPEEHIDNPKGLKDESKLPVYFDYEFAKGLVQEVRLYKGEKAESLQIDKDLQMKNYIHKNIDDFRPSSDNFIKEQIKLAVKYGSNRNGFRHLGAALHVVEDFFAHTNYAELALIKTGFLNKELKGFRTVYPWVEGMQWHEGMAERGFYENIPLVTGTFLTDDTLASLLPKVADKMFPVGFEEYEQRVPGDRTFSDAFIVTMLTDLSKTSDNKVTYYGFTAKEWLHTYENYLSLVDFKSFILKELGWFGTGTDWLLQRLGEIFSTVSNVLFNILLQSTDEDVRQEQAVVNPNYGTNPSHTQLAKDPTNHPLNGLAGELASAAIKDIVTRIKTIWASGNNTGDELAKYVVDTYTFHPKSKHWEEKIVAEWADNNKPLITLLSSSSPGDYAEKIVTRSVNILF